jgi:hypothetical protein
MPMLTFYFVVLFYKTESRHAQIRALAIQHLMKSYEGSDKELVIS